MSRRHRNQFQRRSLSMEVLEGRRLLVVGVITPVSPPQNYGNPEDTNYDNQVTPIDALIVINRLNNPNQTDSQSSVSADIDGDGIISPRDALLIINRLNSGSDKSSVPPEQRAVGLRQSLDAGVIPPNMSLSEAEEMLETLENGGHYESGDRFRNGQMLNINESKEDVGKPLASAEGEQVEPTPVVENQTTAGDPTEPLFPPEEDDPFVVLDSASDTLDSDLHSPSLWDSTLEVDSTGSQEAVARVSQLLYDRIAERFSSAETREQLARAVADAIENGDKTVEEITSELQALRATLGDAHAQIAQLFANLDIDAIIDRLGIDLGTLAEAILSHEFTDFSDHELVFAEFLGREYLEALGVVLP